MKKLLLLMLLIPAICSADPVDIKYNTASQCAPIIVTNSNDELQSAVTASSVTVSVKEGITGTWVDLTLSDACTNAANTWCEEDATKAKGVYRACLATTTVDTKGKLFYAVRGTGIKTRFFSVPVTTYTADEVVDKMPASGTLSTLVITDNIGLNLDDTSGTLSDAEVDNITVIAGTVSDKSGYSLAADQAVNVTKWSGTSVPTPDTAGYPVVTVKDGTGTGEINTSGGRVGLNLDDTAGTLNSAEIPKLDAANSDIDEAVGTLLTNYRLDELMAADSDIDGAAPPTVGSVVHEMLSKTAGSFTFDQTTDSNEAIRDKETDIETDTAEIGAAGAGLTAIPSVAAIGSGGITSGSFEVDAIGAATLSSALKIQLGWITSIPFAGNVGTFRLTASAEAISADNQYQGMILQCGNESRVVESSLSVAGPADIITIEAGRPFSAAPTGTCNVMVK